MTMKFGFLILFLCKLASAAVNVNQIQSLAVILNNLSHYIGHADVAFPLKLTHLEFHLPFTVDAEMCAAAAATAAVSTAPAAQKLLYTLCANATAPAQCAQNKVFSSRERATLTQATQQLCPRLREGAQLHSYEITTNFDLRVTQLLSQRSAPSPCDITLISQLTVNRLHRLETLFSNWAGPAVLAFYGTDKEYGKFQRFMLKKFQRRSGGRNNIQYVHVQPKDATVSTLFAGLYPINVLRNAALAQVTTEFVFNSDIDLVFTASAYDKIRADLALAGECDNSVVDRKVAYIVPAFEIVDHASSELSPAPQTKAEVLQWWLTKNNNSSSGVQHPKILPFYAWAPFEYLPTDYERWINATQPYRVPYQTLFEPFFVGRTKLLPKYDTRFSWLFFDKATNVFEMAASGFEFEVLHDVFLTHLPHKPAAKPQLLDEVCEFLLKVEFLDDVKRQYATTANAKLLESLSLICFKTREMGDMCLCGS